MLLFHGMLPFRKRGQLNLAVKAGRFIAVQIVYLRDDHIFWHWLFVQIYWETYFHEFHYALNMEVQSAAINTQV